MKAEDGLKKKIEEMLQVCEENIYSEPKLVKEKSAWVYEQAGELNDYESIVRSAYFLSISNYYLGNLEESYKYSTIGLEVGKYHNVNKETLVEIYKSFGLVYSEINEIDNAIKYLFQGLDLAEEIGYVLGMARIYNNLSIIYSELEDNDKATETILKAQDVIKQLDNKPFEAIIYLNLGELSIKSQDYIQAESHLSKAYSIAKKEEIGITKAACLSSYGTLYRKLKKYKDSEKAIIESIAIGEANQSKYYMLNSSFELAELYIETGEKEKALNILQDIIKYADETNNIHKKSKILILIAKIYEDKKDIQEANKYFQEAITIIDKIERKNKKEKARFANMHTAIIDVTKEKEELEEINSNLKDINQICRFITSEFEINKILEKSYMNIEKILGNEDFQIFLYDEKDNRLTGIRTIDGELDVKEYYNQLNKWMFGKKETVLIIDLGEEAKAYIKEVTGKTKEAKGMLYIPLLIEDHIIGAICIYDYEGREYSQYMQDVLNVLVSYIAVSINNAQNIESLKEINKELDKASKLDPLTRIPNRRYFTMHMDSRWEDYIKNNTTLSIALIDIDFFKQYNDKCGHLEGDKALIKVAKTLKGCMDKERDFITRFGGEEFIIASSTRSSESMLELAELLRAQVSKITCCANNQCEIDAITVSIGIASERITLDSRIEAITNRADEALYKAKANGRNRVEVYKDK